MLLTAEQLAAIKDLSKRASPGPWYAHYIETRGQPTQHYITENEKFDKADFVSPVAYFVSSSRGQSAVMDRSGANARFSAMARAGIDALLLHIEELEQKLETAEKFKIAVIRESAALEQQQ